MNSYADILYLVAVPGMETQKFPPELKSVVC